MQFLCTMNTSRFRVRPSINQPLLSLPVSLSSTRRSVIHKVRGHERNSRIFSEGHPYFLHLPEMHWIRNGRSNETETGGGGGGGGGEGRRKKKIAERGTRKNYKRTLSRSTVDITDSPHQFHFGTARRAHLSLTLASYRPLDPVSSLPTPKSDSGEHRGASDRRATPGESRGSNKGSHPGERTRPRYILAILRTRRQRVAIRWRRRRNRRSAAISASSRALAHSSSLISSLLSLHSLTLPRLSSPPLPSPTAGGTTFLSVATFCARRFRKPHQPQSARNARDYATPIVFYIRYAALTPGQTYCQPRA